MSKAERELARALAIPKGATKVADKASDAVVYLYTSPKGRLLAMGFAGTSARPAWHYSFRDAAQREKRVREFFEAQRLRASYRAADKAKRTSFRHTYKPGDLFRASWGYDQTNVDWYEVTEVRGADLILREIAQDRGETDGWSGKCVPLPGQYIGEPVRKRAQEGGVRFASYKWASYVAPKMVGGVPVYDSTFWSAYA